MVVDGHDVAGELRRRRIGRPALVSSCDRHEVTTWLPGDLATVPSSLLVLAAMSLARR